ncbi:response regulator transcription factor [Deinococcus pimensis]|uniref:response regulator transcription factor n=1 Tax=Deinococcus pimensis TaxID=309888 RepID=UPI00048738B1|nr:response regulator transcription factor [Deinococcus pimensis]
MKTILIVDDKLSLVRLLQDYLGGEGYRTVAADNGRTALYTARHVRPDLIVLDLMMPDLDGFGFLERYRQEADTPVVVITARDERALAVRALELGADDHVVKPFDLPELSARIRAVLRRARPTVTPDETLRVGDVTLDERRRLVTRGAQTVTLAPAEFAVLRHLMRDPGRVASRAELLACFCEDADSTERTVDVHVRRLRLKLEHDPADPRLVLTVFGVGYRVNPELTVWPRPS